MSRTIKWERPGRTCALWLALAASLPAASAAQESQPGGGLKKALLRFDLIVSNPSDSPRRVVSVGVISQVRSGTFDCLSNSEALLPLADYVVKFHVREAETVAAADPPIAVKPKGVARFTVGLVPNATGACGPWSISVSPVVVFDDGTRVGGKPELITSGDVKAFYRRKPGEEEILQALQHRDERVRLQAIQQMLGSTLDIETVKTVLAAKLDDPAGPVRAEAALAIAQLGLNSLADKITSRLHKGRGGAETAAFCDALGRLRHPGAINALAALLTDPGGGFARDAARALVAIEHPEVPSKIRPLLTKHRPWSLAGAPAAEAECFAAIGSVLIHYRDTESVPALLQLVSAGRHELVVLRVVRDLVSLTDGERIVRDPFVRAFAPALEAALRHPYGLIRADAIEVLGRIQPGQGKMEGILRAGIGDGAAPVRMAAARWAARLGYKSLAGEIGALLLRADGTEEERAAYCQALTHLNGSCKQP